MSIKNKSPLLIRDSREKPGHGWDWPATDIFSGTKIEKLSVGDYSIEGLSHLIFIDRKESVFELCQNMMEKRFHVLIKKAQFYKYKYIICQFPLEELLEFPYNKKFMKDKDGAPLWKKIRVTGKTVHKSIITINTKYGIEFKFFNQKIMAERFCYELLETIYKTECLQKEN